MRHRLRAHAGRPAASPACARRASRAVRGGSGGVRPKQADPYQLGLKSCELTICHLPSCSLTEAMLRRTTTQS